MSTGKIPLYIMIAHSDDDEREIFKTFAEAGPMAEKVPDADTLENTFDAIIHADKLDGDYWLQEYLIIVDRPEWKTDDGVLVINKDFKGSIDGLRMPASEAAINITSMSIANTDWEEYISSSRSPFTWDPEVHFALYINSAISDNDTEEALGLAQGFMQDGFNKRKAGLGCSICPVHDIKPQNVWEAIRYHKRVARELGCNTRFGCSIELENWPGKRYVRVFRVGEPFDSFSMSVDMAGETLHSLAIGIKSWDDEKGLREE
ncbi:uncharacterized protein ACHE_60643S [Aspergillus chevalieri]|uniref:Uncharacterized protein n=1 Tax=Aspergillus chevalieri TaxID=182096 RepID=A0A7R7VU15_ASPCH|nr:uncharacterized protein ACHE_60643S [Aspergillus chevalieri]BCR90757.1 hypothetical protein ACHE_60643S [Aspergillus chevalieri]